MTNSKTSFRYSSERYLQKGTPSYWTTVVVLPIQTSPGLSLSVCYETVTIRCTRWHGNKIEYMQVIIDNIKESALNLYSVRNICASVEIMQLAQRKRMQDSDSKHRISVGNGPCQYDFQVGLIWPTCKQVLTALTSTATTTSSYLPATLPKPQGVRVSG